MDAEKVIDLTYEESQAYMYLGIVAANVGVRQSLGKMKKRINSGELNPSSGDLGAWYAENVADETELLDLQSFRNSVLHSLVIVHPDGSIDVIDDQNGRLTYTLDQLRQWSSRFIMLRPENRITSTMQVQWQCPTCGSCSPDLIEVERGSKIEFPCGLRMLYQMEDNILHPCGLS